MAMEVKDVANMNLFQMLRIGQLLPTAAIPAMHAYKKELMHRAEELRQECADIAAKSQHCEGLLAPIRALPRELLIVIFMLVDDTSTLPTSTRYVIGRVCRHWRSITSSSPAFWSKIDISHSPRTRQVSNTHALQQCLVLSYPHLLDVSLDVPVDDATRENGAIDRLLDLLDGHVPRLRSFKCLGQCRILDLVFRMFEDQRLPNLESLELRYRGTYDTAWRTNTLNAPTLNTIVMNFPAHILQLVSHSLTTYSGPFDNNQQFCSFLFRATNLKDLHVMHLGPGVPLRRFEGPAKAHTNLRKLSLQSCAISPVFERFCFPNLESFAMPNTYALYEKHPTECRVSPAAVNIICNLIQRSQCSLHHLEIGNLIPPTMFLPLFQVCASTVTTLHVEFHSMSSGDIIPTIEMLTIPGADAAEHILHQQDQRSVIGVIPRHFTRLRRFTLV